MGERFMPTREALQDFSRKFPEINASAVEVLILFMRTAERVQHKIFDVLEQKYSLSEGKLVVMIVLYQSSEPLAPSVLAAKAGVTKATISAMLQRMVRDGLVSLVADAADKRGKLVALTKQGRDFMDEVLPGHFMRTAALVSDFSQEEQTLLVKLLAKLGG
ncbi:MAG: MarR family transcriptional regulator [Acidaminococcaceae bacterium]|nr:MarR family transcriptional regulator [Acidaminococcaceae bacterium]